MQVRDSQTFLVSGYTGVNPALDTLFVGQVIAVDRDDAIGALQEIIGDLMVTGATSLEDMKKTVAMLEKVKSGEIAAPVSHAMRALR